MQLVANWLFYKRNPKMIMRYFILFIWLVLLQACASNTIKNEDQESSFAAYIELANSYLQQGNAKSAENSLLQAEEIDSEDARLLQAYGLYYQLLNQNEDAEEMFLAALKKQPDFSQARNNYGVFLSNTNRNAEAIIELSKAAKDPTYALRSTAYENMAEVALKVNNLQLATESMRNAARYSPTERRYFLRAAHLLYLNKNYDDGQEYFNRFLIMIDSEGIEPTSEDLQIGYGIATARKDKATEEYIKKRLELLNPQIVPLNKHGS